jgi:protein-disulfide isomerase
MKRYLPFIIVAAVAIGAVAAGTVLYRAKRLPELTVPKEQSAKKDAAETMHVRGKADARVTLEEFGDFQCPPCGTLANTLEPIEKEYGARLRVIFRNFPLAMHKHARLAAAAAEAAGSQDRFWDMHDVLYREQAIWSKETDPRELFVSYARILKLDIDRFKKDIDSPAVEARIASDQKRGTTLGVVSTPTVFINDHALPGKGMSPEAIKKAIDDAANPTPTPQP